MIIEKSNATTKTNKDDKLKSSPHQIHNNFAKKWLSDKNSVLSFIKRYLPENITKSLTVDDVELIAESFIDNCFREQISDVMIKIKRDHKDIYLYSILEIKSKPDKLTAAQLMSYVLKAMLKFINEKEKKPLPMIYPFILYHGDRKFKYPLDFLDLVDGSKEDIDKYLRGNFQLIDLKTITDDELLNLPEVLLSLPFLCLKHIKDDNLLDFFTGNEYGERIIRLFHQYVEAAGEENTCSALRYVCTAGKIVDKERFAQFVHNVKPKLEEKVVNFVQMAADEGFEKGMERGMEHGETRVVQRLLTNSTPEAIAQLLDWPIEKVKQLAASLTETV